MDALQQKIVDRYGCQARVKHLMVSACSTIEINSFLFYLVSWCGVTLEQQARHAVFLHTNCTHPVFFLFCYYFVLNTHPFEEHTWQIWTKHDWQTLIFLCLVSFCFFLQISPLFSLKVHLYNLLVVKKGNLINKYLIKVNIHQMWIPCRLGNMKWNTKAYSIYKNLWELSLQLTTEQCGLVTVAKDAVPRCHKKKLPKLFTRDWSLLSGWPVAGKITSK